MEIIDSDPIQIFTHEVFNVISKFSHGKALSLNNIPDNIFTKEFSAALTPRLKNQQVHFHNLG